MGAPNDAWLHYHHEMVAWYDWIRWIRLISFVVCGVDTTSVAGLIFLVRLDGFSNVVSQIENNPPSKVLKLGLLLFEIM